MAAPIIAIYDPTDTNLVSSWSVGQVQAGNPSSILDVHAWNNKGGSTAVSDLTQASVACLDGNGETTGVVPVGMWMNVLVDTTASLDTNNNKLFSAIGGTTSWPLRGETVPAASGDVISGAANDGTEANSGANYCDCQFKIVIPINAPPGTAQFILRFQGYYV